MVKTCRKCGLEKPTSEFYVHRGVRGPNDGLQAYCKKCCSAMAMQRAKTPEGKAYYKQWKSRWLKSNKGKLSLARQARRYKKANPHKTKVREFTYLAIQLGVLVRPNTCERCGIRGKRYANGRFSIEAHHKDHDKPLDVQWLCMPCHRVIDKEISNG